MSGATLYAMPEKVAILLDGGFVKKKLYKQNGHFATVVEVTDLCQDLDNPRRRPPGPLCRPRCPFRVSRLAGGAPPLPLGANRRPLRLHVNADAARDHRMASVIVIQLRSLRNLSSDAATALFVTIRSTAPMISCSLIIGHVRPAGMVLPFCLDRASS